MHMAEKTTHQEISYIISEDPEYVRRHGLEETIETLDAFHAATAENYASAVRMNMSPTDLKIIAKRQAFFDNAILCFGEGRAVRVLDENGDYTKECEEMFSRLPVGTMIAAILLIPGESEEIWLVEIQKQKNIKLQKLQTTAPDFKDLDNPNIIQPDIGSSQLREQISHAGNVIFVLRPEEIFNMHTNSEIIKIIKENRRGMCVLIERILQKFFH